MAYFTVKVIPLIICSISLKYAELLLLHTIIFFFNYLAVYDETDNCQSVFIFGGCTSTSTTFNDLWRLNTTTREWSRPISTGSFPNPKACATLVKSKPGELMLFGGK